MIFSPNFFSLLLIAGFLSSLWLLFKIYTRLTLRRIFFGLYALLSASWFLIWYLLDRDLFFPISTEFNNLLFSTAILSLHYLLFNIARQYLRLPSLDRRYHLVFGLLLVSAIGLYFLPASNPIAGRQITQIIYFLLGVTWIFIFIFGLVDYVRIFGFDQKPMHQNRIFHWLPVAVGNIGVGVVYFLGYGQISVIIQSITLLYLSHIATSYQLIDLKHSWRSFLRYMLFTAASFVYLALGVVTYSILRLNFPIQSDLILIAAVILLFALLLKPVFSLINRFTRLLTVDLNEKTDSILQEFFYSIRNIYDLNELVRHIQIQISQIFPVENVEILVVDHETMGNHGKTRLTRIEKSTGRATDLSLPDADPVSRYFREQRAPLSLYLLDYAPQFETTPAAIRYWFDENGFDLSVPIHNQAEWLGLICMGPKTTGLPYTREEVFLLVSIADRVALAFEHARLVGGLTRLNNEYQRAYRALEKANDRLQRTVRQLEKLDRFKSDLITVLSHELRTPMTLIAGYAQLLADEPDIAAKDEWKILCAGILTGTERLEDIVSAILDMSSITANTLELKITDLHLDPVIRQVVESLQEALQNRQIDIQLNSLKTLPVIQSDEKLLEKVFFQLFSNSIKYSPDDSQILVDGRMVTQSNSPLGEESVEITIADRGIGIDQDDLEVVFEKLYQVGVVEEHSSGKTKYKGGGPGLGLAIVKGIIQELHGQVWVESRRAGENTYPGSTFHIVLPVKREPTSSYSEPLDRSTGKKKVNPAEDPVSSGVQE
jgi:signal transduction histidine kinase